MRDPYDVLGLERGADPAAIRRAFRALAKRLHPDLNPGDLAAQQAFQDLTQAYALLIDPLARARWDAESAAEFPFRGGWDGAGAPADIFADFFTDETPESVTARRPRRGEDVTYRVSVPFLLAARGGRQRVRLAGERELEVAIPAGVEEGQVLRLRGQGLAGSHGGASGDALVELAIEPHGRFRRDGADLRLDLAISLDEAINGGAVPVPTAEGEVAMPVPAGSNSGTVLRLKGHGLPRAAGERGDLYVHLTVLLPDPPGEELARFVADWSRRHPYDPRLGRVDEEA